MNSKPLLEVRDLKTQFFTPEGTVRAVDGISFDVHQGEIVGIVGESGAGKSVAARSIMRLVEEPGQIVNGEIRFDGIPIVEYETNDGGEPEPTDDMLTQREMRQQVRGRNIAIIFQDPMESLNPVFTIGGQLREFIEINRSVEKKKAKEIAIRTLREVGIPAPEVRYNEYPHQFSGGMRQRVLIAMALACQPDLIIADEPTTALDVTVEAQILQLVEEIKEEYGTSFIWVTHDMGVVAEVCDRVNVMYLGEIIEQAPVEHIFHDSQHPYTEALLNSLPRPDHTVEELTPIRGVMPEAINPPSGCRFHSRCPEAREVCAREHPDTREVAQHGDATHCAACFRNDVFDVGYESSPSLEAGDGEGFGAGLTTEVQGDKNE